MKRLFVAKPERTATTFWITSDRRTPMGDIYKALVEGRINSIYHSVDAAKSAGYATEKVWKVQIKAVEEGV